MPPEHYLRARLTSDLGSLRRRVESFGMACGLKHNRLQDLVITVNEAASNALEHGGMPGEVILTEDETGVWVEVVDAGGTLQPRHVTSEPTARPTRGMGLWIVRQLCDQVTVDHPGGQSRLTYHVSRVPASRDEGDGMPDSAAEPLL